MKISSLSIEKFSLLNYGFKDLVIKPSVDLVNSMRICIREVYLSG